MKMFGKSLLLLVGLTSSAWAGSHTVVAGETLYGIAVGIVGGDDNRAISGVIEDIMRKNDISNADVIEVGQTLTVPEAASAPAWVGDLYTAERYGAPSSSSGGGGGKPAFCSTEGRDSQGRTCNDIISSCGGLGARLGTSVRACVAAQHFDMVCAPCM